MSTNRNKDTYTYAYESDPTWGTSPSASATLDRVAQLEKEVAELRAQLAALQARYDQAARPLSRRLAS